MIMPAFSRGDLLTHNVVVRKITQLVILVILFDLSQNISVDEYMFFEVLKVWMPMGGSRNKPRECL